MRGKVSVGHYADLAGTPESRQFDADVLQQSTPDLNVITAGAQF
jgi:hypothetical protein